VSLTSLAKVVGAWCSGTIAHAVAGWFDAGIRTSRVEPTCTPSSLGIYCNYGKNARESKVPTKK
jgi:hypothetical protein